MKIIGGFLKGRKLITIHNSNIRPTSGLVKESIFNILNHKLKQANILDLFSGTGALGIEGLSRGAKTALFVDYEEKIIRNIRHNLIRFGLKSNTNVLKWNILKNLNCLKMKKNRFNIIFIDPPYYLNMLESALLNLIEADVINSETCIVVEHSTRETVPSKALKTFILADQRKYGNTLVSFLYPV